MQKAQKAQKALPLIVFLVVLGAARIFGSLFPENLANLQPFGALFFAGMALFGWRGVVLPAAAWLVTYPVTNVLQGHSVGAEFLSPVLGFAAMVGMAWFFRKASAGKVFCGSLLSALVFYLVTNTLSWAMSPLYAPKSFATLAQALWSGIPGYPPSWMFFRNALVSQALFTGLFLVAHRVAMQSPALPWRQAKAEQS